MRYGPKQIDVLNRAKAILVRRDIYVICTNELPEESELESMDESQLGNTVQLLVADTEYYEGNY